MSIRMVLDLAHTVDWAEQLPPDVESIATSDEVKLYADAYPQLLGSDVDNTDSLNEVSGVFDMHDAVIEQVAEYGYSDFFADFDTTHRTPLHMIYRLSDDEADDLFGELEENTSVSYDTVNDMFKQGVHHLVREFEHTPFSLDADLVDELTADDTNLLILQCNRAVEIAELGLLSLKQAQCYLLQHHGLKNKHIADLLDIEPGTVASHIQIICR
jgi:DNA-binding CsgD family transcriptional regulator